jgi:hypothetical protein
MLKKKGKGGTKPTVREQYKSYPGTSPNSLSYWVEMVL